MSEREQANAAQILQFMTTEHTALQTARSGTIFDSNGRTTLYLTSVSSGIVALAFIGQVSEMSASFFLFALVLLPSLLFVGVTTFARTLQSAIEDMIYARAINRIRHYYTEIAPEMKAYFILSTHDDMEGMQHNMGIHRSSAQLLLTTAGMVSAINSVLAGVVAGLGAYTLWQMPLFGIAIGIAVFGVSLRLHTREQRRRWKAAERQLTVMFPSAAAEEAV